MKAFFGVHHGILVALFFLHICSKAQTRTEVGNTVEFGGTVVSLNEQGQQRLQQEVNRLYADRSALNDHMEQLRLLDPLIQSSIQQAALPVDFRFLAIPLDPKNGYWNIVPSLQKQLGLRSTGVVDEPNHPLLTTEAAVVYLARLYQRNANALRTVIQFIQVGDSLQVERLTGSDTYAVLDPNSPALIWKLLARRLVFNHEEPTFRPNRTFILWTHTQSSGQTLGDVAFQYNLPTDRLQPFDGWLRGPAIPTEGSYPVLVRMLPEEYAAATGKLENAKQNPPGPDLGFPILRRQDPVNSKLNTPITLYEINGLPGIQAQPGDNVITLAYYGGISVPKFLDYNDMTDRNVVRPGEVYYLASKLRRAKVPFHVLARGQSLWEVSTIYGVRLRYLLRYNAIEPNQSVTSGRLIWLQRSRPRNQPIEYRQLPPVLKPPVLLPQPDSSLNSPGAVVDSTQLAEAKPVNSDTLSVDSTATISISKPVPATVISATAVTNTKAPQVKRHTVRAGQTYYAISRLYGVTVIQLYKWNKLSEQIPLRIGQELIVRNPVLGTKLNPAITSSPEPRLKTIFKIERIPIERSVRNPIIAQYHIVRPGQTVYRVALINKVSIEQVMRLNKLPNYTIEVGQRLRVK